MINLDDDVPNFYSDVKKKIIKCLRKNKRFAELDFLLSHREVKPTHVNAAKPFGLISISNLYFKGNECLFDGVKVTQYLGVAYYIKPDFQHEDWESELNLIQAEIILAIKKDYDNYELFDFPFEVELDFVNADIIYKKVNDIKEKIVSRYTIVVYQLKYDLKEVIDYETQV